MDHFVDYSRCRGKECTWRCLLKEAFKEREEDFSSMQTTLTEEEMDADFDRGPGSPKGASFTAWGERYVYFPWTWDGIEGVASVPRDPCDERTEHVGGY